MTVVTDLDTAAVKETILLAGSEAVTRGSDDTPSVQGGGGGGGAASVQTPQTRRQGIGSKHVSSQLSRRVPRGIRPRAEACPSVTVWKALPSAASVHRRGRARPLRLRFENSLVTKIHDVDVYISVLLSFVLQKQAIKMPDGRQNED